MIEPADQCPTPRYTVHDHTAENVAAVVDPKAPWVSERTAGFISLSAGLKRASRPTASRSR